MRDPTNGSASRRPRKPIMSAGSCGGLGRARHSAFRAGVSVGPGHHRGSGPAVRVEVPDEGIDDEAVVLAGGAEERTGGDVALGVAELVGGGVDEVGPGDGLCG